MPFILVGEIKGLMDSIIFFQIVADQEQVQGLDPVSDETEEFPFRPLVWRGVEGASVSMPA